MLMTWFCQKIAPEAVNKLRDRVAAELTTTFVSRWTAEMSLREAVSPAVIAPYNRRATGEKYLIIPNRGCV
jgi:NADPH2:quinone reductase